MMIETGRRANPPRAAGKKIEPLSKKIDLDRPCCPFATSDPARWLESGGEKSHPARAAIFFC
jgi:hypothetical protein